MSSVDKVPLWTWLVAVVTFPALPLVLLLERNEFAAAFVLVDSIVVAIVLGYALARRHLIARGVKLDD